MSGVRCPPPPVSGVRCPPLELFGRRKIAPATGFGTLFEHQKPFAHTTLPQGFRDMFRYVLERSFDDSFTIFTIFEKCAFMIFSDFLDIRKNATHFFPHFPARARANTSANTPQALLNLYWPLQGRLRDVTAINKDSRFWIQGPANTPDVHSQMDFVGCPCSENSETG